MYILEMTMAAQFFSADADATTVARLRQTAAREGRTPSQITGSSLKLYLALPGTVRTALRDIDALGMPEDHHNMMRAIARAVAPTQYEVTRRQVAEGMRLRNEGLLETDEDILAEAVRATAKRR
jgi:predicted transcriptional regulator